MFIASSSSSATPTMSLDGRSIPVDEKGFGKIEFVATPASAYDDKGVAKKVLKGQIVTNVGGLPEMVPHKKAGLVCEPNSIDIARSIETFYHIGTSHFTPGIQEEKKKYEWSTMIETLFALHKEIKQ